MNYPCGIIRDLLPLYIDDVCNEESKQAVAHHLSVCEKCRNCHEAMKETEGIANSAEEMNIAHSLKNVRNRINRRIRNIALFAAATVLFIIVGFNLLFNAAIKDISPEAISVSARVYPLAELINHSASNATNSETVTISADENDHSEEINVTIPEIGTIMATEKTIEKCQYATVITMGSEYFLRRIESDVRDHTIYITAFKTTLLNNKAQAYQQQTRSFELQEINRIIFVESDGTETVLWSR